MKTLWILLLLATSTWAFVAAESSNAAQESRPSSSPGAISTRGFLSDMAGVVGTTSEVFGDLFSQIVQSIWGGKGTREVRREADGSLGFEPRNRN